MNYKEMLREARSLFEKATQLHAKARETEDADERKALLEQADQLSEQARTIKEDGLKFREIEMSAKELDEEIERVTQEKEKQTPSVPGSNGFKEWNEFLHACYKAGHREPGVRQRDERLVYFKDEAVGGHDQKQMVESVGASGGFLVPTEFLAQLQAVAAESSIVRPRSTIIRMARRAIDIPVLDQTGTTSSQPHWFGGMLAYWAEEAAEKTITTAEFRKVELVAHKLIMYTRASDELLDDAAISLSDFLAGPLGFPGAVAWHEDYAFLRGTGAGQPFGIISAVNQPTIVVARTAANNVYYGDLVNMMESFLPSANGVWVAHQSVMSNLMTMMDQAGGAANTGTYIWGSAADGVPARLLGLPIIFTEKTPRIGTQGDVLLADMRYYLIGDRQATTVESTQYDYWRYDQTSWRAVHRVDGQPWLSAPLTLQDGTSQFSPFVILGDAESS